MTKPFGFAAFRPLVTASLRRRALPLLLLTLGLVIYATGQAVAGPVIGVAKQATASTPLGGGLFETTVTITVENLGDENLSSLQVMDNLAISEFPN